MALDSERDPLKIRKAFYPIQELLLKRYSPRALSGESLSKQELMTLFEAARWAPSSYNEQEWRFLYAGRESQHWTTFFELLVEANQVWCKKASHLVVVLSRRTFSRNDKENVVHSFDTGAAFQNLLLQATALGLVAHGMGGFKRDEARKVLDIPEEFAIEAMIALGRPGAVEDLPEDMRDGEIPSGRKPLEEIVAEGLFAFES